MDPHNPPDAGVGAVGSLVLALQLRHLVVVVDETEGEELWSAKLPKSYDDGPGRHRRREQSGAAAGQATRRRGCGDGGARSVGDSLPHLECWLSGEGEGSDGGDRCVV